MLPRLFLLLLFTLTLSANLARAADCEKWNTREFFQIATTEDVMTCLSQKADPKARDENGATPLHFAALSNENPAMITALIDAGADLNARGKRYGSTIVYYAAFNKNPAVITALLNAGADFKARGKDGGTSLHGAAMLNENPAIITALVSAHP